LFFRTIMLTWAFGDGSYFLISGYKPINIF
jgi:hypothetical protein